MSKKPSALEQALNEALQLKQAVTDNAKKTLYAELKTDIDKIVKEAIEHDDDSDLEIDNDNQDIIVDEPKDDEVAAIEPENGEEEIEEPESDEIKIDEPEEGIDDNDEDELDLTDVDDDKLIEIFKKIGDDAEISVVKDGDNICITKDGEEYLIKLNEGIDFQEPYSSKPSIKEENEDEKYNFLDHIDECDDEMIYEIVMDDESEPNSDSIDEVARTHADGRKMERKPEGFYKYASSRLRPAERTSVNEDTAKNESLIKEAKDIKIANEQLVAEVDTLKTDLTKHKDALRLMLENLKESALINTNLANINKIICMHPTTADERKSITERFSGIQTTKESEILYKSIISEMKNVKTNLVEEIENKINNNVSGTGEPLLESVQLDTPAQKHLNRVKEIMGYKAK